jgi:hypothetical protein
MSELDDRYGGPLTPPAPAWSWESRAGQTDASERASFGATAITAYAARSGTPAGQLGRLDVFAATATNLATGLMHYAEQRGVRIGAVLRRAEQRYRRELPEDAAPPTAITPPSKRPRVTGEDVITAAAGADVLIGSAGAPSDELADRAAAAVAAYGWRTRTFPGPMDDPHYLTELVGDLLGDLHDSTDQHKINFGSLITAARSRFYDQCAAEHLDHRVGDGVEITRDAARSRRRELDSGRATRGWVAQIFPQRAGEHRYAVQFPGEKIFQQFRPDELLRAPPFVGPPTMLSGLPRSPAAAQTLLIRIRTGYAPDTRHMSDQRLLMATLVSWSGASARFLDSRLPTDSAGATEQSGPARASPARQATAGVAPLQLDPGAKRTASSTNPRPATGTRRRHR